MPRLSLLAACVAIAQAVRPGTAQTSRMRDAAAVVHEIRPAVPDADWTRAHCVLVAPGLNRAGFLTGGEGKAVMSCRAGDGWTAPLFMSVAKETGRSQPGAGQLDLLLLVMNESGVDKLLRTTVVLGRDVTIAAGVVGQEPARTADATRDAEILSYSRSNRRVVGLDLSGVILDPDDEANRATYGADASPRRILATRELSAPTEASAFLRALTGERPAASASAAPPASGAAERRSGPSVTDEDVRTQLVQIQQTIDRLLAETPSAPVGTTGAPGSDDQRRPGTVVVDRVRLLQLRQQIEAAIAALGKRDR